MGLKISVEGVNNMKLSLGCEKIFFFVTAIIILSFSAIPAFAYYGTTSYPTSTYGYGYPTSSYGYGYPSSYGYGSYGYGGYGGTTDVYQYDETTLVIDIYDASKKEMVWRGTVTGVVKDNPDQEEQQKASAFLGKAFLAAVFLIFLVLLTQFNSLAQSMIVISSVVLSLMGVFIGLIVTGMPFGIIMTGIGVISLAGVVVNNAIVLIDYINLLRKDGLELYDALITAGTVRFRPVMLTAITTILGLTPMALGMSLDFRTMNLQIGGESAQWWGPMAVAVIFGLAVATLLTLVVVPVLYSISETFSIRRTIATLLGGGPNKDTVGNEQR